MIYNIGLDSVVTGKEMEVKSYDILPEGRYIVIVDKIDDWKGKDFDKVEINKRDSDGKVVKDDNGKNVKEKASFKAYSADIKLKVVSGEHEGRIIFTNITTHPDVLFLLEGFLYANNKSDILLNKVQKECVGNILEVEVYHKKWDRVKANPQTGVDETLESVKLAVRNFFKSDFVLSEVSEEEDLGI